MAKLLLVDPRPEACSAWRRALEARGHEVSIADNGSFVLTMLERNRPKIIVSHAALEDMSGFELCGIVRTDPMTSKIRFILLTDGKAGEAESVPAAHVDSMLPDDASPLSLVRRVEEVLLDAALRDGSSRGDAPRDGAAGEATAADAIRGALDVLDLVDVIHTLSDAQQDGWLVVSVNNAKGAIAFDSGQPMHAVFQGQTGKEAFASLALATVGVGGATFQFVPSRGQKGPKIPVTIEGDIEKLILSVAVALDEARRNAETPPVRNR